jgi:integrase
LRSDDLIARGFAVIAKMLLRGMRTQANAEPARRRDARTGEPVTAHDFRSTFRAWCGEASHYPTDLAEAALAHINKDKTEAAYARGDLLAKRAVLMEDWAGFCGEPAAEVAPMQRGRRAGSR